MEIKKIDLLEFVPSKIKCGKNQKEYSLNINYDNKYLMVSYNVPVSNWVGFCGSKEYSLTIPKYISCTKETFEALGLLQAEMGKTNNGCIVFCNHEYRLINKVIKWFEKELELGYDKWRWYIKVNINEPENKDYKREIEKRVVNYWLSKTKINSEKRHPKTVTYIKNTKNKKLNHHDYGTLIIEDKSNLLSQIIKSYVKFMSHKVPDLEKEKIRGFMKGILAGESCVEIDKFLGKYRVHITVNNKDERNLYQTCLQKLNIKCKQYPNYKDIIISKTKNNLELFKQKLMCLSPKKYARFLYMINLYDEFPELEEWKKNLIRPHNKISQEKKNEILEFHYRNPDWPCWKIAEKVGISTITVARIRKKYNLGKRLIKTSKEMIEKIIDLHNENPSAYAYEMVNQLGLHKARVERIRRKHGLKRQAIDS